MLIIVCCTVSAQAVSSPAAVWFAYDQSIYQIDTDTNKITLNIPLHPSSVIELLKLK